MADNNVRLSVDMINKYSSVKKCNSIFEELTSAFRRLRNICAEGCHVQNEIISDKNILSSTHRILNELKSTEDENDCANLCLLVGLQFIANLLVDNCENQKNIWKSYENLLKSCLKLHNPKVQNCTAMILYNIFLGHPEYMSLEKDLIEDITLLTINEKSSEFAFYVLHLYITKSAFVNKLYNVLKPDSKLIVIEAIEDLSKNHDESLNTELIAFFVEKFLEFSGAILNIFEKTNSSFEAYEVVKILGFLTSLCSNEHYLQILQTDKCLLINCSMLLKNTHALSKKPDNNFTMIQKLSELNEIEKNVTVQNHPYFGFKCSLIQLIGNLCWNNFECQNKVRELGIIPVLLDCCNIDGRNPFIIQWTILAIRNICHNNIENQKYIAELPKSGTLDVEKLEKMGVLLNQSKDGSTLSISPLEFKK